MSLTTVFFIDYHAQVEQIAWTMQSEGLLMVPALEWDGSLGPKERLATARLGFLLNAYQVHVLYHLAYSLACRENIFVFFPLLPTASLE